MNALNQNTIKIQYNSSVKVLAGWRHVYVVALAEKISEKQAIVKEVIEIDGESPSYSQSRTGAKRQSFNGNFWASLEIDKKKRISACEVLN